MNETKNHDWLRREHLPDCRTVGIQLRQGHIVWEAKPYEWQAWCVVAGPDIAGSGKQILMRGGELEGLRKWAQELTPEELEEWANKPAT